MKRFFTSLVAFASIALSTHAQSQSEYMMKVATTDGEKISVNAGNIEQVTFQAPDAVDKVKQHVREQMKTIAENLDLSTFSIAAQSLTQFNNDVLLSGDYKAQMQMLLLQIILPTIIEKVKSQDAPAALAAQGIQKIRNVDFSVLDGVLTINNIEKTMGFVPGTDGLTIQYTKQQSGQTVTNILKFKGTGSKYQLVIPLPERLTISGQSLDIPEGTAIILSLPAQFDATFNTNAFGGTDTKLLAASFTFDIQSESPYIAGLKNPFTFTGTVDANMPSQTGQPTTKKLSFNTSVDPTKHTSSSSFQFMKGELPVADFKISGNLNPEAKTSSFNFATFDLQNHLTEMLTNSTMSTELSLMGDLGVSINILDGLEAMRHTVNSNRARHDKDKAQLEEIAKKLNEVVNGKFTCKGAGIIDAPIKFQTEQFGVDLVNMPAIDLDGNGTYTPLTQLYDKQTIVYGVNIARNASEPMIDGIKITRQLLKFVQGVIGSLSVILQPTE